MTSIEQVATLATFAAVWAVLYVGHDLADHAIGQTDCPRRGWAACLGHVAQYHLVMALMLALVWAVLPLRMSWTGLAVGLTVSAMAWSLCAASVQARCLDTAPAR